MVTTESETGREWRDTEIVLISALEHFSYCPRQCALIHVEQVWDENVFTLRGKRSHERADEPKTTFEKDGTRIERALPLWSDRYGLVGRADVVEFHLDGSVVPVEYKNGSHGKPSRHDAVQLCAQALCLEERRTDLPRIRDAVVYSVATRKRTAVRLDDSMRDETIATIASVRALQTGYGPLPPALPDDKRCPRCSLRDACMPETIALAAREARLIRRLFVPEPLEAIRPI